MRIQQFTGMQMRIRIRNPAFITRNFDIMT